jgi:hypothetical protein
VGCPPGVGVWQRWEALTTCASGRRGGLRHTNNGAGGALAPQKACGSAAYPSRPQPMVHPPCAHGLQLGLLTSEEIDAAIAIEFNPVRCRGPAQPAATATRRFFLYQAGAAASPCSVFT